MQCKHRKVVNFILNSFVLKLQSHNSYQILFITTLIKLSFIYLSKEVIIIKNENICIIKTIMPANLCKSKMLMSYDIVLGFFPVSRIFQIFIFIIVALEHSI